MTQEKETQKPETHKEREQRETQAESRKETAKQSRARREATENTGSPQGNGQQGGREGNRASVKHYLPPDEQNVQVSDTTDGDRCNAAKLMKNETKQESREPKPAGQREEGKGCFLEGGREGGVAGAYPTSQAPRSNTSSQCPSCV